MSPNGNSAKTNVVHAPLIYYVRYTRRGYVRRCPCKGKRKITPKIRSYVSTRRRFRGPIVIRKNAKKKRNYGACIVESWVPRRNNIRIIRTLCVCIYIYEDGLLRIKLSGFLDDELRNRHACKYIYIRRPLLSLRTRTFRYAQETLVSNVTSFFTGGTFTFFNILRGY